MRGHHDAGAELPVERTKQVEHRVRGVPVEVAGGLVGEYASRPGHERAGDGGALALAARELGRLVRGTVPQADPIEHVLRLLGRSTDPHAADKQRHRHVLERGELGQEVVELVDEAEDPVSQRRALAFADRRHRPPGDGHLATVRGVETAQTVQQGALAGTGRTDERDRLARLHHEIRALQDLDLQPSLTERAVDATSDEDRLTHGATPPPAGPARPSTPGRSLQARTSRRPRCPPPPRRASASPKAPR